MAKLFIVSAPSGAGKTTLVNAVIDRLRPEYALERVVTYTTKPQGPGEQAGIDYHYVTLQDFERKIESGFFLEWSTAYGNYYGSPAEVIERVAHGHPLIMILDRAGARSVLQAVCQAVLIWIYPPDLSTLEQRLRARARDSEQEIERRLLLAQAEMADEEQNPVFLYRFKNENFEKSCAKLQRILHAELQKSSFIKSLT